MMAGATTATTTLSLLTAPTPGAVAILQLQGQGVTDLLAKLTGRASFPARRAVLCDFAGIDHGLVIVWRDNWAQLMPHGGPRVVQKLMDHCLSLGAASGDPATTSTRQLYPEATSQIEADVLAAIARASSPAAVDALLVQPRLWWESLVKLTQLSDAIIQQTLEHSRQLQHLLEPPTIAVLGRPNVGKSTLTNAMLGSTASIVADMPGTTRDWVAGMTQIHGLAVRWLDTPGVHESDDMIEQQAIAMSRQVIQQADVVVAVRDPQIDWPDSSAIGRPIDLWVMNKSDLQNGEVATYQTGREKDFPLCISGRENKGLTELGQAILRQLGLQDLQTVGKVNKGIWAFNDLLREGLLKRDLATLRAYVTPSPVA